MYRLRGDRERAIAALDAAADFAPAAARSGVLNTLGNWLCHYRREEEAMDAYMAATEDNPLNAWAWQNVSLLHFDRREIEESRITNQRALGITEFQAARDLAKLLEHPPAA